MKNEMEKIVICRHCGKPEYYGEMRWLNGNCYCRDCYKHLYKDVHKEIYRWNDLDGKRPTKEEYEKQEKE